MAKPVKIAVLSDVHVDLNANLNAEGCNFRATLLERAIRRLNRWIKPDVTVVLGDVIEDGNAPCAPQALTRVKEILSLLESPAIVIPGNHEGDPEIFYRTIPRPEDKLDINGVRFLPFTDRQEPEHNATRLPEDLARMADARARFKGPIITLQHVPVFPAGVSECPYHYLNGAQVLEAMKKNGITLAISGHYHEGMQIIRKGEPSFVTAPAMYLKPYVFLEVTVDGDEITVKSHELAVPEDLGLIDTHVHSQFAYCRHHDMEITAAISMAKDFGLAGIVFAEHSGQLYFDADTYWNYRFLLNGTATQDGRKRRMDLYLNALNDAGCEKWNIGLEADCDFLGRPVVEPHDLARCGFLIGSIHRLPSLNTPEPEPSLVFREFLALNERFLASGIRVLAHPFRVLGNLPFESDKDMLAALARMLKESNVAAELNFHHAGIPAEFAALCLEAGVKFSFGSDAHGFWEIGHFAPHLELLRECGFTGNIPDILIDPRQ